MCSCQAGPINDHEPRGLLTQLGLRQPDSSCRCGVDAEPGAGRIRIARVKAGEAAAAVPAGGGGCGVCGGASADKGRTALRRAHSAA